LVAIGGTLYCHNNILIAREDLSIATLIIVVAIGGMVATGGILFCYDKCLVARGGLSIATLNI
jgi:hypothetical protein